MTTLQLLQKANELNIMINELLSLPDDTLLALLDNPNAALSSDLRLLIENRLGWIK
jgi:hypothetical protein